MTTFGGDKPENPSYYYRRKYLSWLRKSNSAENDEENYSKSRSKSEPAVSLSYRKVATLMKEGIVDLAGGTAGATVSVYAGQPMDTVKVKMQAFPNVHRTMSGCFIDTFKKEGVRGLYAGTVPALIANIAENSILFLAYGMCQKGMARVAAAKSPEDLSFIGNGIAGSQAAFFSSLTLCPTELVKCRLQAMQELSVLKGNPNSERMTPWSVTRHIIRTEGYGGMFCGLTSTLAREMPGYFFFFGGYELSRSLLTAKGQNKDDIGHMKTFLSGGVAGVSLWTAMFPTDVLKSRIQVMGSKIPMLQMAKIIYSTEGVLAFYNGLFPTLIRSFPATGLLLVTYEVVKKSLNPMLGLDSSSD